MLRILVALLTFLPFIAEGQKIPRVIIAFYDSQVMFNPYFSRAHQLAEMPCNHLGLIFEYYDIQEPLPDISNRQDVRGILAWFEDETRISNEKGKEFLDWSLQAVNQGKKIVIMGQTVFIPERLGTSVHQLNELWEKLGLRISGDWVDDTYQVKLIRRIPSMVDFEREYPSSLTEFVEAIQISDKMTCYLEGVSSNREYPKTCLVTTSEAGGYVAYGYAVYYLFEKGKDARNWYINPFLFFRRAFETESIPKPDTTTIAGRRIYYSHIDGDGWNNQTEVSGYPWGTISATVLYDKIINKYPDLPVTVAPIGADIDPNWVALNSSRPIAKKMFSLPHVEMASHTFTHPFDWGFFENYLPEDEVPFLHLYPNGSWLGKGLVVQLRRFLGEQGYPIKKDDTIEDEEVLGDLRKVEEFDEVYDVPRAFALEPFNLELEVEGSVRLINTLSPDGNKKVVLYQWSGDCRPFYEALKKVYDLGLLNINGGDSRFDNVYPSYAWVAPLGRIVKGLRQIYASNANENLYTNLWRSNFFGFNLLPQTFKNTENPIRIRPINLYYHIYSGQKNASVKALQQNIEYIQTQNPIPIKTSEFSSLAQGFYKTEIEKTADKTWTFCCRGSLQTIRFDQASLLTVNYRKSKGVIGHRHYQGSLYVALDAAYKDDAVVALMENTQYHVNPAESHFYIIQSRWEIFDVHESNRDEISFKAKGFGPGEMQWNVPKKGQYLIETEEGIDLLVSSKDRQIAFTIQESAIDPIKIKIKKVEKNSSL